jgi:hypothetical protein
MVFAEYHRSLERCSVKYVNVPMVFAEYHRSLERWTVKYGNVPKELKRTRYKRMQILTGV